MAPGFKFPPPPPPPPTRAPANDAPNNQRGGRNDRGRGRGGPRGRGQHGGHRGGQQQRGGRGHHDHGHSYGQQQPHQSYNPPQGYGNAASPPMQAGQGHPNPILNGVAPSPFGPGALAQAMAFMATPAGMQSMTALATHMTGGNPMASHGQSVSLQQSASQSQASPQNDSRKRKRNDRATQWQSQQPSHQTQQPSRPASTPKPPRAKAKAAPAVPGFGFSLPTPKPTVPPKPTVATGQNKKRVNLGLTHLNYDDDSSENDEGEDEDEEAAFASKWDGQGITFEHEGDVISLQTAAEVAAFIKDRKRNYPTQTRIAEKAEKAAEMRAKELDFLRKIKATSKGKRLEEPKEKDRRQRDKMPKSTPHKPRLEELREKVKQSMAAKEQIPAPAPETPQQPVDLGLGYSSESDAEDDDNEDDDDSSLVSDSSAVSDSGSSQAPSESEAADSDDDSDAPPDAQSSKVAVAPVVPPPPPKLPERRPAESHQSKDKVCAQWKSTGKCKYKYCKFKHEEEEPRFVGLYERMVEKELEEADKLALEAIKYLGRNGFLG